MFLIRDVLDEVLRGASNCLLIINTLSIIIKTVRIKKECEKQSVNVDNQPGWSEEKPISHSQIYNFPFLQLLR